MDSTTVIIIIAAAIAAAAALAVVLVVRQRRSHRLREQFGTEYTSTVEAVGDRQKAEAELRRRETRVGKFTIRQLSPSESDRYAVRWRKVQADFIDSPAAAIAYADDLLSEVMTARGYPTADFEQRAADLSVEHPTVVSNYRAAHELAVQHARGEGGTEELRRAMIHFRDLFAELDAPASPAPRAAPSASGELRTFREEPARDAHATEDNDTRSQNPRGVRERLDGEAPLT